ncbi:hypothetical protein IMSAGC003_02844 [Lachnospiraceae bacterium]|nr:hypothetical protein [Acetatifactor sp.]GFH96289.1 hypothetical protein IMSAGC003_02844 [Lachnospiraceae bacterium]
MLVCRKWMGWIQLLPFTVGAVYNIRKNQPDTSKMQRVSGFVYNTWNSPGVWILLYMGNRFVYSEILRIMAISRADREFGRGLTSAVQERGKDERHN